ncbi:hypothetical protein Tco_1043029 [Tanacetum coccineum]|uniref:Uncharacterized protein n=1 Tax=Tanacetum coccineum TaxID=301880 RepID=A0ABQ5GLW2_9ASTR
MHTLSSVKYYALPGKPVLSAGGSEDPDGPKGRNPSPVVSTGAFIVIDAEEIRFLLKEQATTQQQQVDAFQAQVAALHAELQATRNLIQLRQGGG